MKKNLQKAAMFAAVGLFTIGAAITPAQMMVGNFREIAKNDATAVEAAKFAVAAQSSKSKDASLKLVSIERAERQIVAGSNYQLCLNVNSNGKAMQASSKVYLNLQNQFSLSDWRTGSCGGTTSSKTTVTTQEIKGDDDETVSYKGALEIGKTMSTILYVGEDSGDYAAFCFLNASPVGRAVLAACKTGEQCEFVGKVDFEKSCAVKNLEADLSASGTITAIESVKSLARKTAAKSASGSNAAATPDAVVRNLYAAQKADKGPFFQFKNRSLVDQYFVEDLAEMIWKDSVEAKGEVGAIDFDPLYGSQEETTNVVISKPSSAGGPDNAFVKVTFNNAGKADMVDYELQREPGKAWKIVGIYYSNGEDLGSTLRYAQDEEFKKEFDENQTFTGDYLVGKVKCSVMPTLGGMKHRVECEGQTGFKLYMVEGTETETAYINVNAKGVETGKFVFKNGEANGKFVDAAGKTVKVVRVK